MASPERTSQQFSLHWDKCHQNLLSSFEKLLNSERFVDVSLAVESKVIKCHKIVLSACSEYFEQILIDNPCEHPVIVMIGMKYWKVLSLVNFMYRGEVSVEEECLDELLKAAEALQIRGLAVIEGTEKESLHSNRPVNIKSDGDMKPKKLYSKPKNKKFKPNTDIFSDEIEVKNWTDCSSKDNKTDGCKFASSGDTVGNVEDDKTKVKLTRNALESSISQKNIVKDEVHMEYDVNTGEVDTSLDYDNFEDDDLCSDNALMQMHSSDPGPSHHFLNMDTCSKVHLADYVNTKAAYTDFTNKPSDDRLTGRHFPQKVPPTASKPHPTRRCYVHARKGIVETGKPIRKETSFYCPSCDKALKRTDHSSIPSNRRRVCGCTLLVRNVDGECTENWKTDSARSKSRKALNMGWSVRLTDTHFPVYIPSTLKKKNPTRSCHVCANSTRNPRRRRESRYMCSECKVTLCVAPCFQDYHTLLNY